MRIAIAGAGPVGLYLAIGFARRGNDVTVIDRDSGPQDDETWARKGVMQFDLPHFFRPQVRELLLAEAPDVVDDLLIAGAMPIAMAEQVPDFLALRARRSTVERVLRRAATRESGVTLICGHADAIAAEDGKAIGVMVDGTTIGADLVIDATGRSGRLSDAYRAPATSSDSGFAYAGRQYQLLPGAEPGPMNSPPGWGAEFDGFAAIIFLQDDGVFQPLIIRRSNDKELAELRHNLLFEKAAAAIPSMADWTDPTRSKPISNVMAGAGLFNSWRGQLDSDGDISMSGLIAVGDTVMTTDPADGKGVTTSLMQARALLDILDKDSTDFTNAAREFHNWCDENLKPWYDDMVANDVSQFARWSGEPMDLDGPLSSDLICTLIDVDPSVMSTVGPYWGMLTGPDSLKPLEDRARINLKAGHRWSYPPGPTRDELATLIIS